MYAQESLQDILFVLLYGGITMLAVGAGFYMWLRRSNAIDPAVTPPRTLRLSTAAFFFAAALSHVWWYVLGVYWLTDDRLVRDITAVTLDHIILVPLVMAVLLHMLQDRRRRLWPWVLTQVPIVVAAGVGIARHDEFFGFEITTFWQLSVMIVFVMYYIYALVQYGRWLHENYADMEHKEVWQSLLFMFALFAFYEAYFTNPGELAREYLAQAVTLVIIAFLIWRVETLQQLEPTTEENVETALTVSSENEETGSSTPVTISNNLPELLGKFCEDKQLYLQHDLTLQQLATAIGTNRTYLSRYFAQQGITYNVYINRLRIYHFIRLYRESIGSLCSVKAQQLARESGFYSYGTFSSAFKKFTGDTVTAWMKHEEAERRKALP